MYAVYQPDPATIDFAAARARRRLPHLATRITLAVAILRDLTNRVSLNQDGVWLYHNQRNTTYRVDPTGCTCPNYLYHASGRGRYYCKHLLALFAWRRILIDSLKCFANPHGICNLRTSANHELVPATPTDFALVSHYLATGRNYRPSTIRPYLDTEPTSEWQPSPATRRWLATGEVVPPLPT